MLRHPYNVWYCKCILCNIGNIVDGSVIVFRFIFLHVDFQLINNYGNCFRLVLLNKLLEDGNTLYRKGRLKEAAYRYTYALNKFPPENELDSTFKQLQINFYLNTSRCKRKLNVSKLLSQMSSQYRNIKSKLLL